MMRYIVFHKIVETGSFTRAAEELGYTQAAVSQMMRAMEAELRLGLFVRMRTGIRLTPEGEALCPIVRKIVAAERELNEKVRELCGMENGEIRIGVGYGVPRNLLPSVMQKFAEVCPAVRFVLRQGESDTVCEKIRGGQADLGLVCVTEAHGLNVRKIADDPFAAVLPAGHPLSRKNELFPRELAGETLIAYTNEFGEPQYAVSDDIAILAMVRAGLGVGILPESALTEPDDGLCIVPIRPVVTQPLSIVCHNDDLLPGAAKRFIEFLYTQLNGKV